ncbi:MAG TPA: 2-oxo-4-hydroxy-4-carboxy-5-ureidoimidazoline decarboxylase [Acidobacteriaceae bacterium]|jgi:2-oxo-4-hydroxy-4-carboxy-5-ureidoimidazoline decarboxylase|nr:2-oxo-4-hydroxy-4-carboxy-5-ureidoimidazoline decarboxylase [Acidobacteriaceae bacterium]
MPAANTILEDWNGLERETAMKTILPCNGSRAWAIGMVKLRPLQTPQQLFAAADKVWQELPETDWQQAFDSHPRLGESKANSTTAQSLRWSAGEQSAAKLDGATQAALAEANRAYEAKFGRIFILCATGRSAAEVFAILEQRLRCDAATELREAAEQQRLITQLRLRKWLQLPTLTCAELASTSNSGA